MPLFRGNGKHNDAIPADTTEKGAGYCAANISIRKKPEYREVEIIIIDCKDGSTVYKSKYRTNARSDFAAHNRAIDEINAYAAENGYTLQDEPTSNAQLPSVTAHQRGGRWR